MSDASLSLEIKELNACVERMCATNDLVELKTAQEFFAYSCTANL